uniref:Calponin-homology (CH) domain-containing protein n=1 Tax=Schistosoma mansoni TaxID=6183 RepID=A0A5K4F4A1_SCHMA
MVNFHYSNKDLYYTSQYSSSSNQHDHLCHDDQHCTKHLNYTEWDSLKSIELNENVKPVSNLLVLDQLSTISNNNDHDHKSPRTDDTTTIESWTPSIDQSFIRQELLLNRMKSWKLYRNTSPLNYFSNMNNNTSNMDNLPEKYSVKCRFRTFEDVPKDQIDDNLATVHIFNQYLMNNEYEHGDQLQILTNAHSSPDISENLTEQFITPSVSDGVTLDADNQELDHNTRLNARHRIYDEYLKSLEKRYNIKMNQSNEEMNRTKNLMDYDLIPHSLYITTSVDGLHSMLTTVQMDSLKSYPHSIDQKLMKENTTEEKIIANKCEQERVQKKTFTNWLNTYLSNANPPFKVQDLFEDIKNGILLIRILEVLSGEKLRAESRAQMNRIHCLSNIKTALEFLHSRNVKLVNVNPTDIADGKPAIVLGLIWVIILYFQIEEQEELLLKILDLPPGSLKTRGSAKRALQAWVQEIFAGSFKRKGLKYDVQIRDFGPSWRDGIAFNAMVHNIDSSLVEMDKVKTRTPKENLEHAFTQAEKHLGIPRLLDPEDVDVDRPDEKSIVTYVAQFFKAYPDAGRRRSDSPTKTNVKVKLDNLMKFIRESESKMKTVRFGHTNLNEQYQVYEELIARKEMEEENYESLKDQWYSGLISHTDSLINPSEVEILEESWNHFTDIMNEWLWEIDEKIPGEFGRIAKWLSQAEKWFKQVGLKWYQKPSGTQAMGFCVTVNQSWRPSSAEPPNSPPSNELIDKLQNERLEIFGTNNQKLNSIRDDLSRIIDNEKKINLPNTLIDRLSTRLSKVIGYEPGHSAVLCAAKSRRTFLDILYNVNRTETNTGVRIRSRRRESATGFEYRFCNWLDLVDGNIHTETKEIVNGILNDYQLCLKTEHIPEKLDQCKSDLSKHFNLLIKINQYDDQLLPQNALDIIQHWQNDCEIKWNSDKFNQLIQLGERIKQRLTIWDKLDHCNKNIENLLSQFEDSTFSENDWLSRRDEIFLLLEEANEAAHYLGESADHHRLEMFRKRIEKVESDIFKKKQTNLEKLEAKRMADKLKFENEMNNHLNKIEYWIDKVKNLIENKTNSKLKNLQIRCTSNEFSMIIEQLQELLNQQPQIIEHLQNATNLSQDLTNIQCITIEQNDRLDNLENLIEKFTNLLSIKIKDLIDMKEKIYEIEKNLAEIDLQIKNLEDKQNHILLNSDMNTWEYSPIYMDFNDCRGHLTFANGQVNDLERALNLQDNHGMAILNKFSVEELYNEIKGFNDRLNNAEKVIKRKLINKQSIDETFTTLKQQMDEIQIALKDLKYATSSSGGIRKEDLLNLLENLKTLRRKYTESIQTNDRRCQNFLNSAASEGDGDMLLNEMKMKISQMKNDINEQCTVIDHEMKQLDIQLNKSLKNINEIEEKTKQTDQWLINQERRLTVLSTGPSIVSYDKVDSITEQLKSHQQWVDDCKNLLESIKKYSEKYNLHPEQDDVDSVFVTGSPLSDLVGVMCKRMEHLKTDTKKIYNIAEGQLRKLNSFSSQIGSSRKWLQKCCNEHTDKLNDLIKSDLDHTDSLDQLEAKHKCLTEFASILNKEGEAHLIKCQEEIQHILDSDECYDTTVIIMLTRRELSNFQSELNIISRENDKELKEIEAKIARQSKFISHIEAEEKWLNDLENKMNQDHSHLNNSQSTAELLQNIQTETDRYNQLLSNINTHDQQIDEQLYPEAQSLKDSSSLQRIDNLKGQIKTLKQNLEKMVTNLNVQTKSIHAFQQAVEKFKLNLKNFESQRSSILEAQTVSYVNMESDSQLLEEFYMNMKKQIEDLRTNQSELLKQLNDIEYLTKSINPIPNNDLDQLQQEYDQFHHNLEQNHETIQIILNEFKQLNQLINNIKNYLKQNLNQISMIIQKEPNYLNVNNLNLNELNQFYQFNFNEIKQICHDLGIELTNELSLLNHNESSKFSLLHNEINEKFNKILLIIKNNSLKQSNYLTKIQKNLNQFIEKSINDIDHQFIDLSQFMNHLNQIITYSNEIESKFNSIQVEYDNIQLKLLNESNDIFIQSLNQLINQLNNEINPYEITFNKFIQNIQTKNRFFININHYLLNYLKQFINKKEILMNNIKETIKKYEQFNNIELNYLNNFNDINNEFDQLLILLQSINQFNNIDFDQQIQSITDQYSKLNNRYKTIYDNFIKTNVQSNKINELNTQISIKIEKFNEHLNQLKQNYEKQKINSNLIQKNLNQIKDYLNQYRIQIIKNINQFSIKSINDLTFEQIINNFLIDLNDYLNDFQKLQEIINKMDIDLNEYSKFKKIIDLSKLIMEINNLNNKNSSSLINWNDFLNELSSIIEWLQNIIHEFNIIQSNYQNLLNKIKQLQNNYNDILQLYNEKSNYQNIDIHYIINNEKSIKLKLIHELDQIKQLQLFNLLNNLQLIKQQSNQLYNKPQSNIQLKFIDDLLINDFINQMDQSLSLLSNNINNTITQYKSIYDNEYQFNQLYHSINEWIHNYENDLLNIEQQISNLIIEPIQFYDSLNISIIDKNIENYLNDLQNLNNQYFNGEKLLQSLINKFNQYDELCNHLEINKLNHRITEINKSRLNYIKTNLLQYKNNLDQFISKGNTINEQLNKYEQRIDKLKQISILLKINKLEDLLINETLTDTLKLNELLIELEGFKHDVLDPYEVLYNKTDLKLPKDYVTNFKKRYDTCLTIVKDKTEEIQNHIMKLRKLKEKVEEFNKSFEGAHIKYKMLFNQFKIEFDEQYTHCKLSEICQLIMKMMQQIISHLKEYDLNFIEKLQTTLKDISSQALECELKLAFENSLLFDRLNSLKSEITDYTHGLDELYNQLKSHTTDIINYEQWFENIDKQYQQTKTNYTIGNLVFNKSSLYQSITECSIHELENESNNNSASLGQLNSHYQKSLQTLLELRKLVLEYNPSINILTEKLLTLIRQIINIHKSFSKINIDLQSNRQIINNPMIYGIDIIEQNCINMKSIYQNLMNHINQDINNIQIKSTYLIQLIQSNKDLDIWIKDCLQFINQIKQETNYTTNNNDNDNGRIDQIQLKLDIGKTYLQSIHEWIEQLKQHTTTTNTTTTTNSTTTTNTTNNSNEINTIINNLFNQQYKRSNEIYQYIIKLINTIKQQQLKQNQLKQSIELEYLSYENWFKKWKENLNLIKIKISKLLINNNNNNELNEFNLINIEINQLLNELNELNKELINKQTLLLTINNTNNNNNNTNINNNNKLEFNQSIDKKLSIMINEMKENQLSIEQIILCLKRVKTKLKEFFECIKTNKQWINEINEQLNKIKNDESPIRISPYPPSKAESMKPEYSTTNTQYLINTEQNLSLKQSNELKPITSSSSSSPSSSSFLMNHLLQQYHIKFDKINNFMNDINNKSIILINNMNNLFNEFENDLIELQINYTIIINNIDFIQNSIQSIYKNIINNKNNIQLIINQLNQLNNQLNYYKQWLMNNLLKIKNLSQKSIIGINDLSINQYIKDNNNNQLIIDIYYPIDGIIQNYQVFQSELMSQKSELTQLNSLCESIQQTTNDSGARNSLNQLLMQYHNLIKSCEDVLSKLQLVFMENREFQVLCNSIRNLLNTLTTELKSINTNDQNPNLSENHLNTITSIREKLRSSQPKLLELSDRADRICRASSTAALTMNQMFMIHSSQLDITDSANKPMLTGYNHQLSTNQIEIDNLQTETIGSKAKRQLNEFRKEFNEISQQITEYQEKLNHLVNEQKNLSELYNDLRSWMDKTEKKLNILELGKLVNQTETNEQNIRPIIHGSTKFNENNWNIYIQQVTALNKELNEYSQKYEQFCENMPNTTNVNGQTNKYNQLMGRFTEMKGKIQQFTSWINTIQQNYSAFRDSAQTTERWMSSINFRLMSSGNNNTNSNLTGNLSAYQDSTAQIDQLMKEIDKEGKSLLENTHQLVHLLIHGITKDQTTISRTNRICDTVTCPYREIPMDHSVIDNWKYLVNSSNEEKLLDRIALDALERNKEVETSYINIHSNAQSIKSRLDDQLNRFKAYIDSLNSVATFILNDLQSWWKRLSVISQSSAAVATIKGITTTNQLNAKPDPISSNSYNVTGFTTYPNKSFINYQIDRLKQLTNEKPPAKAVSLEDVGHQLAMTLAMQSQLITMKRELSTLGYKCGMSSVEIDYISQEGDTSSDNKGNSSDQTLVKLLAKHVQNAIDIENKKLECHTEQLRELRTKWEHYVKERDIFGRWLSERQTACHHLLELRSRSTQPEDEESRALEFIQKFPTIYKDFLNSLKDKEYQINELTKLYQDLIQHNTQILDPLLDRLNTEYKNLLNQTKSRIDRVKNIKNERKPIEEEVIIPKTMQTYTSYPADEYHQSNEYLIHTKNMNNNNNLDMPSMEYGLRNSGGNRGIARLLWPYDHRRVN